MAIFQRPRKSGRLRKSHQRRGFKESFKEEQSESDNAAKKNGQKSRKNPSADAKNSKRGPQISLPSFNHCNWSQTEDPQTWRTHQKSPKKSFKCPATSPQTQRTRKRGPQNLNQVTKIATIFQQLQSRTHKPEEPSKNPKESPKKESLERSENELVAYLIAMAAEADTKIQFEFTENKKYTTEIEMKSTEHCADGAHSALTQFDFNQLGKFQPCQRNLFNEFNSWNNRRSCRQSANLWHH